MFLFILHINISLKPTIQFLSSHAYFLAWMLLIERSTKWKLVRCLAAFFEFFRLSSNKRKNSSTAEQIFSSIYPSQPFIHRHKPFFFCWSIFRFQFLYEYSRYILNNSRINIKNPVCWFSPFKMMLVPVSTSTRENSHFKRFLRVFRSAREN